MLTTKFVSEMFVSAERFQVNSDTHCVVAYPLCVIVYAVALISVDFDVPASSIRFDLFFITHFSFAVYLILWVALANRSIHRLTLCPRSSTVII